MTITLTILNADTLPSGAPAFFRAAGRSFRIGREPQLDWTLPDPSRQISSRHCEVRFEGGAYVLHDQSTNGIFLNGAADRLRGPHRLADGDRLRIGQYVIEARVGAPAGQGMAPRPAGMALPQAPAGPVVHGRQTAFDQSSGVPRAAEGAARADDFLEAFSAGAGLAPGALSGRDPAAMAREVGAFVRLAVENLAELLKARAAAKAMVKSRSHTMLGAADNNPLKFVPSAEEAIEIMFAPKRPGYLDARRSLADAFADLKLHELATYHAMQKALAALLDELDPETIESRAGSSTFSSKKARAWDIFVERWEERSTGENGMLDEFLALFAEAYDDKVRKSQK